MLRFRIIPDNGPASQNPSNVRKVVFCSGKVYYDIKKARSDKNLDSDIAIVRVEQVKRKFKVKILRKKTPRFILPNHYFTDITFPI